MPGRIIVTILAFFLFSFGTFPARAVEKKTSSALIILPFDTTAAGKYSYLKESLRNMLTTRLAVRDDIRVLDESLSPGEMAEIKALKHRTPPKGLFSRRHADYIVTGVLSAVGEGMHLQLTFHPASGGKSPLKLSMSAENEEGILPSLDRLVVEIGGKVGGSPPRQRAEEGVKEGAVGPPAAGGLNGMAAFQTPHPERMYKTGIYGGGSIVGAGHGGMQATGERVRRSTPISMDMVAMAVGDLDGDGVKEIVLAGNGELLIYHFRDGRFSQVGKASLSSRLKVQAMDLADLNHEGRDRIYISATVGDTISSLIAEWDARQGLHIVSKEIPWYLRPLQIPGKGMILAGQESGVGIGNLLSPGIYALKMNKGLPIRGEMLPLPREVNLFDFVFADLKGDGQVETVAIDKEGKLRVYDQGKTLLWVSTEQFGGSTNYLGPANKPDNAVQGRIFVPPRLIAVDLGNGKKQEILVATNIKKSHGFLSNISLSNFRMYDGGFVSCMEWTGAAMQELWHTNTIDGMVVDYNLQLMAGPEETLKTSSATQGQKGSGGKQSAVLFVGRVPGLALYNLLLPKTSETEVFAYDLNLTGKATGKE